MSLQTASRDIVHRGLVLGPLLSFINRIMYPKNSFWVTKMMNNNMNPSSFIRNVHCEIQKVILWHVSCDEIKHDIIWYWDEKWDKYITIIQKFPYVTSKSLQRSKYSLTVLKFPSFRHNFSACSKERWVTVEVTSCRIILSLGMRLLLIDLHSINSNPFSDIQSFGKLDTWSIQLLILANSFYEKQDKYIMDPGLSNLSQQ